VSARALCRRILILTIRLPRDAGDLTKMDQ